MYLYASHLGGYFGTGKKLENRVCGICGDEDVYIGAARDAREAKSLLSRYVSETSGASWKEAQAAVERIFRRGREEAGRTRGRGGKYEKR